MGLNNHAYLPRIQKGSDQPISSIGFDNPPTEVIPTGFTTYTALFESKMVQKENVKSDFGSVEWFCNLFTYIEMH